MSLYWLYKHGDTQHAAQDMITTNATVRDLTRKVEGWGHKLYMDNFLSFPLMCFTTWQRRK